MPCRSSAGRSSSTWTEHQPSASDENAFIDSHGYAEYGRRHLAIDDERPPATKGRYKFPFGDFSAVHRCAILAAESHAGQREYTAVELAAAHLHGMPVTRRARRRARRWMCCPGASRPARPRTSPRDCRPSCARASTPMGRPSAFTSTSSCVASPAWVGADEDVAQRDAKGVFAALWSAVGPKEFADMRAQLPKDFGPLLDEAVAITPPPDAADEAESPTPGYDELLRRVAERSGLDEERARRAFDAVLGVTKGEAAEHARAVLRVLREAVGEKEWHDTTAQLPDEYRTLWRRE